jgi:hypothetical protein
MRLRKVGLLDPVMFSIYCRIWKLWFLENVTRARGLCMAKHVLIFGAGASKHLGAPLMNEFIDAAYDVREANRGIATAAFDLVFDFLNKRLTRLHAKSKVDLGNIESVFSLLEMGRLVGRLPGTEGDEIDAAVEAIRQVLVDTLQWTCRFPLSEGNPCPSEPYLAIAQLAEEALETRGDSSIACLTFNYDIGLDYALHWSNLNVDYGFEDKVQRSVPVLKLHGSMHWLACPSCAEIVLVPLSKITNHQPRHRQGTDPRPILVTPALSKHPAHCAGAKHDGLPAIVPPSWNKTQYHEKFGKIWRRAAAELAEAQEITVIGYSMPASDGFFRDLLALGLADGERLRRFTVVDWNEQTQQRYQQLLGPDILPKYDRQAVLFEEYAKNSLARKRQTKYGIARMRA